jgi:uncharacterized membrane protein YebE (DUF533 family)
MDHLVDDILRGVLGGRRKRSKKALRFITRDLTRGVTRGVFRHPGTLLGIAGVAWGIFETLQNQNPGQQGVPATGSGGGLNDANRPPLQASASLPPLPKTAPVPGAAAADDPETLRMVRLAVSAANADGVMNEKERAAVLAHMTTAGAAALAERELATVRPLPEIIAGVSDRADRATLYVLAYTILRADEQINGAERIYLAQLANLLGLDAALVAALEKDTGERIDALGDQGQLGG